MVLDELKDWLNREIENLEAMPGPGNIDSSIRIGVKRRTLRTVRQKITELESQFAEEPECNCYICANQRPCFSGNWAVTCDKDGKTCDNFIERGSDK